jgi:hypothetical protein
VAKFKVGDRVRTLDQTDGGIVQKIQTYQGMGDKLLVDLDSGHQLLLATEMWRKEKKEK